MPPTLVGKIQYSMTSGFCPLGIWYQLGTLWGIKGFASLEGLESQQVRQEWVGSRLQEGEDNFLIRLSPSFPCESFACHGLEDEDGARSWSGALPI